MGRMIRMIDRRYAFLSPAGPFGGAYAIRPYHVTRKMIAVVACSAVLPEKQAAFGGMLWGGRWKPRRVFMSLCRGVLNTPHKRPIYGANGSND